MTPCYFPNAPRIQKYMFMYIAKRFNRDALVEKSNGLKPCLVYV